MLDRSTRWFLRWRDRGDAAALAAVFDRTAPELLRLALHLGRNVADAEDLVQGTFLAAIESAPRFERSRRVGPWLAAILTHLAQAERRRRQRARPSDVDPDAMAGRDDDPAQSVSGRELDAATRAAIDLLPEPCRQPTMLRVCHGLEPAAIALLLARSPGTVRAQIHRGLEQLRRRLPASAFASLALGSVLCGRGLAAVKTAVLEAAGHATGTAIAGAAAASTTVLAGIAMTKKTVAVAALLLAATTVLIGLASTRNDDTAPAASRPIAAAPAPADAPQVATASTPEAKTSATVERTRAAYDAGADAWQLRARVVDGSSLLPIAGAAVALHGPRTMSLLDLQREFHGLGRLLPTGGFYSHLKFLRGLPHEFDERLTLAGAQGRFLVPPPRGEAALAQIETDADGGFTLPVATGGGLVRVSHPRYGERQLPFASAADDQTITLWPVQRVTGQVLTQADEVPPAALDLLLIADDHSAAWPVTTDASGKFAATVAARRVNVSCRTPGWTITQYHSKRVDLTSLRVPEGGTVYVARFGSRRLHVTDARSGAPIETIWVLSRDGDGIPRHCGRFHAQGGCFELMNQDLRQLVDQPELRDVFPNRIAAAVWSDGYASSKIEEVASFGADLPDIEVPLAKGTIDELAGRVTRSGAAAAGLRAQLRPFHQLNWQGSPELLIAATVTTADGTFLLRAPAGEYLLEILDAGRTLLQQPVLVPGKELPIDLAGVVQVTVEVVDAQGKPVPEHNVAVNGAGGQQRSGKTGADGRATFGPFDPGTLVAAAPLRATNGSWVGGVTAKVEAAAGTNPTVQLRLPNLATIRPLLVFEGAAPATGFAGFLARNVGWASEQKDPVDVAVERDGTVPLDLLPADARLRITAPGGRQWRFTLPPDARPGHQLLVRWSGLAYAGVLTDAADRPIARARVFAEPVGGGTEHSAVTDATGAFRLEGLDPCRYVLGFHADENSSYRELGPNALSMVLFDTAAPPATPPATLRPRVPRFADGAFAGVDNIEIAGRALDAATRQPVANAVVSFESVLRQEGGELRLFPPSGWKSSATDGRFRVVAARGDCYRQSAGREGQDLQRIDWAPDQPGARLERDVLVR